MLIQSNIPAIIVGDDSAAFLTFNPRTDNMDIRVQNSTNARLQFEVLLLLF